jgi:4-amino-4-deoxy-L-arabinose transferase-like glycosyltransferase
MMNLTTSPEATTAQQSGRFRRWWAGARTSFFWMVLIAFAIRLLWIVAAHTYKFRTSDQNFGFGWEMGRIGRALALGKGFSNPFDIDSGPTAWEPPLYPYLIGYVFRVFGIYTHASALALLTINSFFSALNCVPIFLIVRRCFGEKLAVWGAWTWTVFPSVIYWCTHWVWETSLSALLLSAIFWLALSMEDRQGWRPWAGFGLLWGIAALNSPVLLAFLPASGLWALYYQWKAGRREIAPAMLSAAIFFACIAPWLGRNHEVFGKWVFLRSNFGAELRMGNGPGADGTWMWFLHPTQNYYELARYKKLGELAYIAERKQEAIDWIRQDPARFAGISLKKFVYYWGGVPRSSDIWQLAQTKNSVYLASSVLAFLGLVRAIRKRKPGAWLFFWLLLLFPPVYYIVFPHPRYRHPIEPEMGMLIVYVISEAERKKPGSRFTAGP